MSETKNLQSQRMAQAAEGAKMVGNMVLPELGSAPRIVTGTTDSGDHDELKFSVIPAEILLPLAGLSLIARTDKREDVEYLVDYLERGLPAINGGRAKDYVNVATAFSGGGKNKVMKHHGWVDRNLRGKPEHEEVPVGEAEE